MNACCLCLLLALAPLETPGPEELARRGEAEFSEGVSLREDAARARPHFREAARCFEELARSGARNPSLYRNLGNSYFLAGDLPRAILAFREGLKVSPDDPGMRERLTLAREEVAYPQGTSFAHPPGETQPFWLPSVGHAPVFALAGVLYTIGCVLITRWLMARGGVVLAFGLLSLALAACLGLWLLSGSGEQMGRVVVLAEDGVLLRKGNALAFPPRYDTPLPRGTEATLRFERGDWLQIRLSGGEVGWVPRRYAVVEGG